MPDLFAGLGAEVAARLGDEAGVEDAYGTVTVDVPAARWVEALTWARDELGCSYWDWLSAVDELDAGFAVVASVWRLGPPLRILLMRTRIPRDAPLLSTLTGVYRGAAWHEREAHEMFGLDFEGHPDLKPLLLPDGFEGHPLRKEFVLASRVARPWPGAKEPGESEDPPEEAAPAGPRRARRRVQAPGVPDPGTWGPPPGASPPS